MVPARVLLAAVLLSLCLTAHAAPEAVREVPAASHELNVLFSGGRTVLNWHGNDTFRSLRLELVSSRRPRLLARFRNLRIGVAGEYHYIRQPRSWFGFDGDPILRVKAGSANVFVRRVWDHPRYESYIDLGSGPMWGTQRMPAATSHFNFDSQLGLGVVLSPRSRTPLQLGYRFSHVSNAGLASRNPGLNLHSLFVGFRFREMR
jgi:opacity protein-like surface antigen